MPTPEIIVGDFETYYKQGSYSLAGVRKLSTLQYITDQRFTAQSLFTHNLTTGERKFSWYGEVAAHVLSLELENKVFVAHNNYFDGAILLWRYGVIPQQYVCTKLMSMAVIGTELKSHSLSFVAEHLGCAPKLKSMLNEFMGVQYIDGDPHDPSTPAGRMKTYNVQDVDTTVEVFTKLAELFPGSQWWHMDWALRQFCNPVLRLDSEQLQHTATDMAADEARLFQQVGIPKSEFTSADKFCNLLRAAGVEPPMKLSEKKKCMIPALSKTDLEFQELKTHENPVVRRLCELRAHAASNIMMTRAKSMFANSQCLHDNVWPMHVNYSGAMQTHRLSGSDGAGGNPLNLPRKSILRNAILPARGFKLYGSDEKAFELRIARLLAQDHRALGIIYDGGDVYCDFASEAYGYPVNEADHPDERQVGKTCIAEGSLVLTNKGLVPIEQVTTLMEVWDGTTWVQHGGLLDVGVKQVITYAGLTATPDHVVYCADGVARYLQDASDGNHTLAQTGTEHGAALHDKHKEYSSGRAVEIHHAVLDPQGRTYTYDPCVSRGPKLVAGGGLRPHVLQRAVGHVWFTHTGSDTQVLPHGGARKTARVYDLANAGPRHRYTVSGRLVANSQLSLQYGVGHKKFVNVLRLQNVDMDMARGKAIVDLFRYNIHKPVHECWQYFDRQVIPRMLRGDRGYQLTCAPFIHTDGTALVLPSGLRLNFRGLKYRDDGLQYLSYSHARRSPYDRLYSAKIFQYCCQSLANEVLMTMKQEIERQTGCRVVMEVYDELVTMVPTQDERAMHEIAATIDKIMCTSPSWWPELQLKNDAHWGDNYGQCK